MDALHSAASGHQDAAVAIRGPLVGRHPLHPFGEADRPCDDGWRVLGSFRHAERILLLDHQQVLYCFWGYVFEGVFREEEAVDYVVFSHICGEVQVGCGQIGFLQGLHRLDHADVDFFVHPFRLCFEAEAAFVIVWEGGVNFVSLRILDGRVDAVESADGLAVDVHEAHGAHAPVLAWGFFHFFLLRCVDEVEAADVGHHLLEGGFHPPGPLNVVEVFLLDLQICNQATNKSS